MQVAYKYFGLYFGDSFGYPFANHLILTPRYNIKTQTNVIVSGQEHKLHDLDRPVGEVGKSLTIM